MAHPLPNHQKEITADDLVWEFPTVFGRQVRLMDGELFSIKLKNDAKPFCVNAPRSIPYAYRDKVRQDFRFPAVPGNYQTGHAFFRIVCTDCDCTEKTRTIFLFKFIFLCLTNL